MTIPSDNNDPFPSALVDFGEDAPLPTDAELSTVAVLARRQREAEDEVVAATAVLQGALDRLREVRDVALPKAMLAAGARNFTTGDGVKVAVVTKFNGTKLTSRDGLAWVEEHGGAPLIKTQIMVELDRGDLEIARNIVRMLRDLPSANSFRRLELTEEVNAMTMGKFARELTEANRDPPLDLLGVHRMTYAVVGSAPKGVELKGLKR